jgi:hypothetical protein
MKKNLTKKGRNTARTKKAIKGLPKARRSVGLAKNQVSLVEWMSDTNTWEWYLISKLPPKEALKNAVLDFSDEFYYANVEEIAEGRCWIHKDHDFRVWLIDVE